MMKFNKRFIPVVVILVAAVVILILVNRNGGAGVNLNFSGTVEATEARLGFEVPGRVAWIAVREGDTVAVGQSLATLDTTQAHAQRVQLEARADAARAVLTELLAGSRSEEIAAARAADQAARDRLEQAQKDMERTATLYKGGAVSEEAYDKARTALRVAQSQADQAGEQLRLVEKGPRPERIEAQRAETASAEAAARTQDAVLALMTTRAPFGGVVTVRHREPGESLSPGMPVVTVANLSDRWVRIYVPENRVGQVRIGQKARLTADSFPGKAFEGRVVFIASEAEFTPKNVQTSEERVKLVYMVKVEITGDRALNLKPGMPADVVLEGSAS
jgi:HlyD family secretion protein